MDFALHVDLHSFRGWCKRGHPLVPENLNGGRSCRACNRAHSYQRRHGTLSREDFQTYADQQLSNIIARGGDRAPKRKDQCHRGHDMSQARIDSDGKRHCRPCSIINRRERIQRRERELEQHFGLDRSERQPQG